MRFASIACLTCMLFGCSEKAPTAPTPPVAAPPPTTTVPPQSNSIQFWGYVVTPSGDCIEGATVEGVGGPVLRGQKATQVTPCDRARLRGGFVFEEGVHASVWGDVTVRASAPGFVSQDQSLAQWSWDVVPTFTLTPIGR